MDVLHPATIRYSATIMFNIVAAKLAHSPTIHALSPGNSNLRLLQEIIVTEKLVLQSYVRVATPAILFLISTFQVTTTQYGRRQVR